jgi:branched-chain amino acid transport system substrate-binding protein
MRLKSVAYAVSACVALCCDSISAAGENDPIMIGVVLPLTGEAAHWGVPPRNGAELAAAEINNHGGIAGRKLVLMVEDDRCNPADGIAAFEKIMAAANAPAILGAVCSSVTLAIAPHAESRKAVLISPASTSPRLTGAGEFIFRVVPSGSLRGKVFAEYVYRDRGLRKVAVLYINNEGGIGGSSSFKQRFLELGGTVALEEAYPQGRLDLRAELAKLKAADPEGVLVGSYPPDTVAILKQARELRFDKPLFFTTEAVQNPDVLREAGDAANGAVYILAAAPGGEAPDRFRQAYTAKLGHAPELFAAEGYDIVRLLAEGIAAVKAGSVSGASLRDFLHQVRNYAGASGTITFDQNGDVTKPYAIRVIEAGSPKTLVVK